MPGASKLRGQINDVESYEELEELFHKFLEAQNKTQDKF